MTKDINPILEGWPHEPGQVSVRKIRADDGSVKIQLRVELGLLQMESEGRPDGQRPMGYESLLHYYEHHLQRHIEKFGSDEGFWVDARQCEMLRAEATQYYYRYLSKFVLEEFEGVAHDTARNLRVLEFCSKYAREESDRYAMEQYRPYIVMMNGRAKAQLALQDNRPRMARKVVLDSLGDLKQFFSRIGQEGAYQSSKEVGILEGLLRDIQEKIPPDPLEQLKQQLQSALREERYEEAAALRDAIAKAQKEQQDEGGQ